MIKHTRKIRWKKGSSILEFSLVSPFIFVFILALVVIAQLSLCRISLENTAYHSARAAVVCEDYESAVYQMNTVAVSTIQASTFGISDDGIRTALNLVAGTTGAGNNGGSNITWEKGALVECTITVDIDRLIAFGPDTMSTTVYVMVERPVATYY